MTVNQSAESAERAAVAQQRNAPQPGEPPVVQWLRAFQRAYQYGWSHPLDTLSTAFSLFAAAVTGNNAAGASAIQRTATWAAPIPPAPTRAWVNRQLSSIRGDLLALQGHIAYIEKWLIPKLRLTLLRALRSERAWRIRGDQAARLYAQQQVTALHSLIEREAASAYRGGTGQRLSLIQRVAGLIANRNPVVRRLAGIVISGVLDLLSVDNPVARIALGFVMRRIVDRLGVDKLAAGFTADLLGPLLGDPRPHDLAGVVRDISARLGSGEQQWGQFYENGGSDVEQAGRQWAEITSPLGEAALIAWLVQAVADPQRWAQEITDVTGPALTAAAEVTAALIRGA